MRQGQRGGIVFDLIMVAAALALLGGVVFGVKSWWHSNVYVPAFDDGVAAQIEKDAAPLKKANDERDDAERNRATAKGNFDSLKTTCDVQSQEVTRWKLTADANKAEAHAAKVRASANATLQAPYIADLVEKAAAAPKLQSCEETNAKADKALTDALRLRRPAAK